MFLVWMLILAFSQHEHACKWLQCLHTQIWSGHLENYKRGRSALRSRLQLFADWRNRWRERRNAEPKTLSNKSKCCSCICNTVRTFLHCTKMLLTRDFKDRPSLHTHITNASDIKKKGKRKTLGTQNWRKNVGFLSHSIRQRSQICLEWSQASRTEWFLERRAENGAPWQRQKSSQLYLQFQQ